MYVITMYIIGHYMYVCNYNAHNWSLQRLSQDYNLQLLTSLMLCVFILYMNGGTYSSLQEPTLRLQTEFFFVKLFRVLLFTLRAFGRILLRGNCRRNIFSYCVPIIKQHATIRTTEGILRQT